MAQSGWHVRQDLEEENVLEGQLETHFPPEASWLLPHVRQNDGDPAHVPQDGLHATINRVKFRKIKPYFVTYQCRSYCPGMIR